MDLHRYQFLHDEYDGHRTRSLQILQIRDIPGGDRKPQSQDVPDRSCEQKIDDTRP